MIHMIFGNTGAGKTTYAQNLKKETKGVIFSIDEWNNTLFIPDKMDTDGVDWFLERIKRVDTMIQSLVMQMQASGTHAILDLGFAKEQRRMAFYAFAKAQQIPLQIHFLDVPKGVRKKRVVKRNTEKGETFQFEVSESDFEFMESWFERPNAEEIENAQIITF